MKASVVFYDIIAVRDEFNQTLSSAYVKTLQKNHWKWLKINSPESDTDHCGATKWFQRSDNSRRDPELGLKVLSLGLTFNVKYHLAQKSSATWQKHSFVHH